jgi:hypothetical protein
MDVGKSRCDDGWGVASESGANDGASTSSDAGPVPAPIPNNPFEFDVPAEPVIGVSRAVRLRRGSDTAPDHDRKIGCRRLRVGA